MLALDFFGFFEQTSDNGIPYPVTDGNLSTALCWSQAIVAQPAIQSLTSASGLLRRATRPLSACLSLYWMFGTPQRHNTTDGPTRLQKMHANSHPTRGPVQARHYSACWCSSPWAETARKYCVEERSGPQGPSPTAFENIHDASPSLLHCRLTCSASTWLQRHCFRTTRKLSNWCGQGTPSVAPTYRYLHHQIWRCRPGYTCSNQDDPSLSPLRHGCIPSCARA